MLESITENIYFDGNDDLIFFGKSYSKSLNERIDYGLIVRHKNPFSPDKKIIVLAGCGSHGVLASSMLFENSQRFKDLNTQFRKKRGLKGTFCNADFFLVIKCHFNGNDISNIQIVDSKLI